MSNQKRYKFTLSLKGKKIISFYAAPTEHGPHFLVEAPRVDIEITVKTANVTRPRMVTEDEWSKWSLERRKEELDDLRDRRNISLTFGLAYLTLLFSLGFGYFPLTPEQRTVYAVLFIGLGGWPYSLEGLLI